MTNERYQITDINDENSFSMLLFEDSKSRVKQVKFILKLFISIILLLALNDAFYYSNSIIPATEYIAASIIFIFLYYFLNMDTINIVSGILLWTATIIASYTAWKYNGLYDTSMIAFPGALIFAGMLGRKELFYPLFVYMIAVFYFLAYAHNANLLEIDEISEVLIWRKANNLTIVLIVYAVAVKMISENIKVLISKLIKKQYQSLELQKNSAQLIYYDHLTKLPNELSCQELVSEIIKEDNSNNELIAFLTLNLHNFDWINSSLGHIAGDEVLCRLSQRLNKMMDEKTKVFRSATNEFLFIMEASDYQEISEFASQLLQAVSRPMQVDNFDIENSGRIGISLAPFDGFEYMVLRQKSHTALSQTKVNTDQAFKYFEPEMEAVVQKRLRIVQDLKQALELNEFELYYQPKVYLYDQSIVSAEALIRWNKGGTELIPPNDFISIAEESGLISEIGKWAIEQACKDCKKWHELGLNELAVAVNLSPVQFKTGNLPNIVFRALREANLSANFLDLEITESLFIDDTNHTKEQINQISKKGVSISIDDFGTGYSNLNYLTKFNASTLKIDMSFVRNMLQSEQQQHIVQAIIEMSKVMALDNVAEGVEDFETFEKLRDMGCQFGQGYYWSKPLPNEEFIVKYQ